MENAINAAIKRRTEAMTIPLLVDVWLFFH